MQPERDAVVPKKLERKGSRLLLHTQTRARKGEERERVRSFNHEEVQREFVSKLTRYE